MIYRLLQFLLLLSIFTMAPGVLAQQSEIVDRFTPPPGLPRLTSDNVNDLKIVTVIKGNASASLERAVWVSGSDVLALTLNNLRDGSEILTINASIPAQSFYFASSSDGQTIAVSVPQPTEEEQWVTYVVQNERVTALTSPFGWFNEPTLKFVSPMRLFYPIGVYDTQSQRALVEMEGVNCRPGSIGCDPLETYINAALSPVEDVIAVAPSRDLGIYVVPSQRLNGMVTEGSIIDGNPDIANLEIDSPFQYSTDGSALLIQDGERTRIIDVATGAEIGVLSGINIAYSPDASLLAMTTTSGIAVLDAVTLEERWTAEVANIQSVAFGLNGRAVLAYSLRDDFNYTTSVYALEPDPNAVVTCTLSATRTVNLRGGAGTNFAITGQLTGGQTVEAVAKTTGSDRFIWYQLSTGDWVREDVITPAPECAELP